MKLISLISSNPPEFKIEKVEAIGKENQLIDESFEKQKLEVEIIKHQPNLKINEPSCNWFEKYYIHCNSVYYPFNYLCSLYIYL
jgi:hypothetical protein